MNRATPISSFPAIPAVKPLDWPLTPRPEITPVSCCRRSMAEDPNFVVLTGYDAHGGKWIRMTVRLDYAGLDSMERLIHRESQKWQPRSGFPAPPRLLRIVR